jgi:hypothetical protein
MLSIRFPHNLPLVRCHRAGISLPSQHGCPVTGVPSLLRCSGSSLNPFAAAIHTSPRSSSTTFPAGANVDITSLENTLQAHREANRVAVVRKVSGNGHWVRLEDPDRLLPTVAWPPERGPSHVKFPNRSPPTGFKGTSRNLDALWRINNPVKNLPLRYRLPWLRYLDNSDPSQYPSAVERLTAEIRAFENYTSPSEEEERAASDTLQDLVDAIGKLRDGFVVDVIGSRTTGLADPLSDIDIHVSHPDQLQVAGESLKETPKKVLNIIVKVFETSKASHPVFRRIDTLAYLKRARVPILLCRHRVTGLPIQIQSTPRTYDSREYVKAALREYPSLRGLFKVLKQLLQMRGLTVGSSGGITSYPLLQMIVAALKFSGGRFHPENSGNQLLFFLDFYSDIDFSQHGISTDPLELFPKAVGPVRARDKEIGSIHETGFPGKEQTERTKSTFQGRYQRKLKRDYSYLMTLQDPANPLNDLGKSCFQIKDVQETFIAIRAALKRAMAEWDNESKTKADPEILSLLEPCIGGDYQIYEHERDDLRRCGRSSLRAAKEVPVVEA